MTPRASAFRRNCASASRPRWASRLASRSLKKSQVEVPNPATNAEFTKSLGEALGRPTILPMPAFAARLAFGEMADEMLLASLRVEPRRAIESGYGFRHPELGAALAYLLRS